MIAWPEISPHAAAAIFAAVLSLAFALRSIRRTAARFLRSRWARGQGDFAALRAMSPNEFEKYAAAAFEARGWRVEIVGREGKPDGGLDLLLTEGIAWKVRQTTLRANNQRTSRRRGYPAAD